MIAKRTILLLLVAVLLSACFLCACSDDSRIPRQSVTVTVINGEHYSVHGDNKRTVVRGKDIEYEIVLENGYELVSAFGAECDIPSFKDNPSFTQKIALKSVKFDTSVSFETRALDITGFKVFCNLDNCHVSIKTSSGYVGDNSLFANDLVTLTAEPCAGYRFECWSTENFLASGGKYLNDQNPIVGLDYSSASRVYANFRPISDTAQTIVYDFGNNVTITQNCSAMMANHPKANTLTEPDLLEHYKEYYSLPTDKMLVGWETTDGKQIRLGGRVAVSDETYITLTPLWKRYSPEYDFVFSEGKITKYLGSSQEVVVPRSIKGEPVTCIASAAFEGCTATTYYLPNTITDVEENAFLNCAALTDLYMSDNIVHIKDNCFRGCKAFETLHLNAYLKPRFMTADGSTKCNIYDELTLSQNKKCVLFGGSNVSYAYNVQMSESMLNGQYDVFNLGYNANMCGYVYYDIIEEYLKPGDIFIHAPEQNKESWCTPQVVTSVLTQQDSVWVGDVLELLVFESNLQLLENITINKYSNFFNSLEGFNIARAQVNPQEYYDFHHTVCDVQFWQETVTGEMNSPECNKEGYSFNNPPKIQLDTETWRIEFTNEGMYIPLLKKGVIVCITFPVTNRHNLYLTYENEENLKTQADAYTQKVRSLVSDDVVMLLSQYDAIYDGEHFSNSDWHIGYPTREKHTEKLIKALVKELSKQGSAK